MLKTIALAATAPVSTSLQPHIPTYRELFYQGHRELLVSATHDNNSLNDIASKLAVVGGELVHPDYPFPLYTDLSLQATMVTIPPKKEMGWQGEHTKSFQQGITFLCEKYHVSLSLVEPSKKTILHYGSETPHFFLLRRTDKTYHLFIPPERVAALPPDLCTDSKQAKPAQLMMGLPTLVKPKECHPHPQVTAELDPPSPRKALGQLNVGPLVLDRSPEKRPLPKGFKENSATKRKVSMSIFSEEIELDQTKKKGFDGCPFKDPEFYRHWSEIDVTAKGNPVLAKHPELPILLRHDVTTMHLLNESLSSAALPFRKGEVPKILLQEYSIIHNSWYPNQQWSDKSNLVMIVKLACEGSSFALDLNPLAQLKATQKSMNAPHGSGNAALAMELHMLLLLGFEINSQQVSHTLPLRQHKISLTPPSAFKLASQLEHHEEEILSCFNAIKRGDKAAYWTSERKAFMNHFFSQFSE